MSPCSLIKGVTQKICRLCFCVLINKRSFDHFRYLELDLVLEHLHCSSHSCSTFTFQICCLLNHNFVLQIILINSFHVLSEHIKRIILGQFSKSHSKPCKNVNSFTKIKVLKIECQWKTRLGWSCDCKKTSFGSVYRQSTQTYIILCLYIQSLTYLLLQP